MINKIKTIRLFNIYGFDGGNYDGNVYDVTGCSSAITTKGGNKNLIIVKKPTRKNMGKQKTKVKIPEELKGKNFAIRQLTEKECFRLMGVDDADIDKIQNCGVSSTAQRRLAGNSIVVDVLFHIFRKMFIEQENENQQLRLF